jgi:HlyD family secretion protein
MQNELDITKKTILLNITKAQKGVLIAKNQKVQLSHALKSTQSLKEQNQKDYERAQTLYDKALIAKQKLEYSQLTLSTNTNKVEALQQQMDESQRAIEIAQDNYKLALTQKKKIQTLQANIDATKNKIKALQANRDEVQIVINELTIKSPINGYVLEKVANKGEVLDSGMIVATLIEPQSLYLKVFVDTIKNGKVKIGDDAVIFLDAYPNEAIKAKVVSIASNAEFTPKDVAVRSDRIQRVFAVHLKPLKLNPLLKLGIPAVGVISIDGKGLPASLHNIPSI